MIMIFVRSLGVHFYPFIFKKIYIESKNSITISSDETKCNNEIGGTETNTQTGYVSDKSNQFGPDSLKHANSTNYRST